MKKKIIFFMIVTMIALLICVCVFVFDNNRLGMLENEQKEISNDMMYNTANMLLISDYNTFYTLEKITKNIIIELKNKNYKSVLGNVSESYFEKESNDVILEKFQKISEKVNNSEYEINEYSKLLYRVYEKKENLYNCTLDINGDIYYILIYLNKQDNIFEIYNLVLTEE